MLREVVKKEQRLSQQEFVGGMKNPMETVEGLPPLQNLGRRILGAWERHCNKYRDAQAAQGLREDIGNYTSVVEQEEDARVEIDRLIHCGYAIKVKKEEAAKEGFGGQPSQSWASS